MKRNYLHIVLAVFLTFAVTDYIWINLFQDDEIGAELETEKEQESEEEIREDRSSETKHDFQNGTAIHTSNSFLLQNTFTGFVKHGKSFRPLVKRNNLKLYILHSQIRVYC